MGLVQQGRKQGEGRCEEGEELLREDTRQSQKLPEVLQLLPEQLKTTEHLQGQMFQK